MSDTLKLENQLKQKKHFVPINGNEIRWYTSVPIFYETFEINHARHMISIDIIHDILSKYFNYDVVFCLNINNIESKIIQSRYEHNRSTIDSIHTSEHLPVSFLPNEDNPIDRLPSLARSHRVSTTSQHTMRKLPDGASTYEKRFVMDLKSMKIKSSTVGSRSSEYIDETIKFIEKIMEKDYGYTSNSSVYFNLLKFYQEHGDLELSSYRTGDTGASSAAGAVPKLEMFDKEKQNQYDFMLWKRTNAGEPGFESPWGYGLPNSDIQCNVLAKTLFGMPFDIVTHGLNDQIFKYNNELGQAEGFLDDVVMNYLIDVGKCIMKDDNRLPSSNNIQDMNYILKKFNIDMKHVRLLCLLYPWMSSLTVDQNNIDEIKQFEKMLKNFISDVKRDMNLVGQLNLADSFIKLNEKDIDIFEYFRKIKKQIHHALCDCIDTSSAMDLLRQLIDTTIKYFYESHENVNVHSLENILEFIFKLLHIFGLNYD